MMDDGWWMVDDGCWVMEWMMDGRRVVVRREEDQFEDVDRGCVKARERELTVVTSTQRRRGRVLSC